MKPLIPFVLFLLCIAFISCNDSEFASSQQEDYPGVNTEYMDTSVEASEDFYRFVNGKWMDETEIPSDRGRWGSFDELRQMTSENTLSVLNSTMENNKDPESDTDKGKAAIFYSTAMDTNALDKMGLQPISSLLSEIEGISTIDNVINYLKNNFKLNGNPFFSMYVRSGFEKSDINSLYLGPGSIGLPERDYYVKSDSATLKIQSQYKDLLNQVFSLLNGNDSDDTEMAQKVFMLEKQMAENQLTKEQRRNTNLRNNPRSVEQINEMMSFINIPSFLDKQGIQGVDTIIVTQPDYISGLEEIIQTTDIETHKAYLKWTLLNSYSNYLDSETEDLMFSFYGKKLEGTEEMKPRWERVLNSANRSIGEAIGQLYVEEHFPPEAKEEANRLVENVKKAFRQRLTDLEWMTDTTKQKALEKLETFTVKIGYPDEWKDYSELTLTPISEGGSYASNMMAVRKWNWQKDVKEIGQPVDKSEWFMAPQVVNAYYNPSYNEIVFPAAILQPPFFDFKADPAVNYGGIGAVIGHEISHGFDDQGSRFDADGNLKNWWTKADRTAFEERAQLLIEQYNNYKPFDDLAVNGEFTLGENIGDLGGVNVAYDALMLHLEKDDTDYDKINGFTQEQRFFISWATIWRTKMRDEALRKRIKTDPHSPGQYRAIGPISNMDEFYTAFEIEEGDSLYIPKSKRIKIW